MIAYLLSKGLDCNFLFQLANKIIEKKPQILDLEQQRIETHLINVAYQGNNLRCLQALTEKFINYKKKHLLQCTIEAQLQLNCKI